MVTMDYQDLKERTGAGTTLTGELLAPETVRRMACDAAIIPAVLGEGPSCWTWAAPCGWRRRSCSWRCVYGTAAAPSRGARGHRRGATPTMRALVRRRPDRPEQHGAVVPAAPHDRAPEGLHRIIQHGTVVPRHHTIVHQKGYTATITTTEVTWHL